MKKFYLRYKRNGRFTKKNKIFIGRTNTSCRDDNCTKTILSLDIDEKLRSFEEGQ